MKTIFEEFYDIGLNIFGTLKIGQLDPALHLELKNLLKFFGDCDLSAFSMIGLVGNGGPVLFKNLPRPIIEETHPFDQITLTYLDRLSKEELQGDCGLKIIYPNDQLKLPLQKISQAMNLSYPSALGIDISPEYGLWFGIRGIFLIKNEREFPSFPKNNKKWAESPCLACHHKPCLIPKEFDQKRLNCPIGSHYRYSQEQLDYHLKISSVIGKKTLK